VHAPPHLAIRTKDPDLTGGEEAVLVFGQTFDPISNVVTDEEFLDLPFDLLQTESRHASKAPGRQLQMKRMRERLQLLRDGGRGTCQALER
jgi:hypothetical protein